MSNAQMLAHLKQHFQLEDAEVAQLLAEARREAVQEAKAQLKQLIAAQYVEQALAHLDADDVNTEAAAELAALRQQLAENEAHLAQLQPALAIEADKVDDSDDKQTDVIIEAEPSAASDAGYYVYAIIPNGKDDMMPFLPTQGIDAEQPLYLHPHGELQAIVSRVSFEEFGEVALKANLADADWLERKAREHHNILEAMMGGVTLLPMRFCTICYSEADVTQILTRYYDQFVADLARLKDQQEWGVKIFADFDRLETAAAESEAALTLKRDLDEKSNGTAYLLKKQLSKVVLSEVEQMLRGCIAESEEHLATHAEEQVILGQQHTNPADAIFNGAYLVPAELSTKFLIALDRLTAQFEAQGFRYELTGPWPPYNFIDLEVMTDESA